VIPSEHHVAVPANEKIVFAETPDGPPGRGRINDASLAESTFLQRGEHPDQKPNLTEE
jgi:hypothetical protein